MRQRLASPAGVRKTRQRGLWFARLFILPHTIVGVCLLGLVILRILLVAFGTDTIAVVTNAHESRGSKRTTYRVDYRYSENLREHEGSDKVTRATYAVLNRPLEWGKGLVTVRVAYIHLGFIHYDMVVQGESAQSRLVSILLFALFWNGVVSIFVYQLWIKPFRRR